MRTDDTQDAFNDNLKQQFNRIWALELKKPEKERRGRDEVSKQAFAIAAERREKSHLDEAALDETLEMGLPLTEAYITVGELIGAADVALDEHAELGGEGYEPADLYIAAHESRVLREGVSNWWKSKRSLTAEERKELKIPSAQLQCSVAFVKDKGFCAYTHRARSKFYKTVAAIPGATLKFISSTS